MPGQRLRTRTVTVSGTLRNGSVHQGRTVAESVRVNLSVSAEVDAVLKELATVTGRSKSSLIMEAVGYQLPPWRRFLERLQTAKIALSREERQNLERRETPPLSRQQRRAMEREERKTKHRSPRER